MEKVKNLLKEKEQDNESLSKQFGTLKDLYARSVSISFLVGLHSFRRFSHWCCWFTSSSVVSSGIKGSLGQAISHKSPELCNVLNSFSFCIFLFLQTGTREGCGSEKTEGSGCDCWPSSGGASHRNGEGGLGAEKEKFWAGDPNHNFKVCVSHHKSVFITLHNVLTNVNTTLSFLHSWRKFSTFALVIVL